MTGREEYDIAKEKSSMRMLEKLPSYMMKFYYSQGNKSNRTKEMYLNALRKYFKYLSENSNINVNNIKAFKKIRPSDIEMYVSRMSCGNTAKRTSFYAIKAFFDFLEMDDIIDKHPMAKLKPPKESSPHEAVCITPEELNIIYYTLDHPPGDKRTVKWRMELNTEYKLIWKLGLITGLRSCSIRQINLEDIDFEKRRIVTRQKGNYVHYAYYNEEIERCLKRWLVDRERVLRKLRIESEALFINKWGSRMNSNNLMTMFQWSTSELDRKITPHNLRSTCCTTIIEKTGDIIAAQDTLGHKNIRNTMRYNRTNREKSARVAIEALSDMI